MCWEGWVVGEDVIDVLGDGWVEAWGARAAGDDGDVFGWHVEDKCSLLRGGNLEIN